MPLVFETSRRVEFRETDAAGIAHFTSFFGYMEEAEHALLRELGMSVVMEHEDRTISFPRVHADCDYHGAAKFEEVLTIQVSIKRLGKKSVTYSFRFERDGAEIATGQIVTVCCIFDTVGPPVSVEIPAAIRETLAPYLDEARG